MTGPPVVPLIPGPARAGDRRLAGWRANVGEAVARDARPPTVSPAPSALVVLSWNVWVGRGRLTRVVERLREGGFRHAGAEPGLPLVILLQEALRTGNAVPERSNGWAPRERIFRAGPREDIVESADRLGLHLRYAPSMRNGPERSDRGNAILSSLPLADASAVELPFEYQRRVAVTAGLTLGSRALRLVSAHLDPRGPVGHKWLGAAGRAVQMRHLLAVLEDDTVVLGADLNLGRGRAEPAWRSLMGAGFRFGVPAGIPPWRHTYHALPRLVLDYVLVRDRPGGIASARVHRLDEDSADRGPTVFGSDHHPLLARIDFQ
ncbi:MAG TPA: endonuclease/exonuclease/phosphatase family protein [Gemmatimonadales bacterium]|nr:endonuclease/exonuclease/phosphatase family protein [Gemmatimonadales bacterium]